MTQVDGGAFADAALRLTVELVGIDSVNPGLVPGAAGEREIVDHLRHRLTQAGFETQVVGSVERPSLVAAAPAAQGTPTVVLNGHLDTVGTGGMGDPFDARLDGGRLHGRGAADMKGGVAAMVVAAEHLAGTGAGPAAIRPVRPVLALVADEEDASLGSEAVIAALPDLGIHPDVCVIGEPTDLALARTLRGYGVVRVTFAGVAAHSSQPELGRNAVSALGRLLAAVERRAVDVRRGGGDLMVTSVRGGGSPFVVPDQAECVVERRTTPAERAAEVLAEVEALLDPAMHATGELLGNREGWRLDSCGPAAGLATELGAALGTQATFEAPYWMEAPLWQAVCPTVVCGPSGGGLHADDEWLDLGQLRSYANALPSALIRWAKGTSAH